MVVPTEPRTEKSEDHDTDQPDWSCSDDDFDQRCIVVIIRTLSEGGTEQEGSDGADIDANDLMIDPPSLINPIEFFRFLDNCNQLLLEYIESKEEKDDDGLSHLRKCYMNTPNHHAHREENGSHTLDQSPHGSIDIGYEVPYETSLSFRT